MAMTKGEATFTTFLPFIVQQNCISLVKTGAKILYKGLQEENILSNSSREEERNYGG